ncbi:AbrB/MazE/SpoVT family DNA-binding domain-containing protein [Mechercharimyces sp. CAU 1602]|uniref:AbrB/MazE/SpoVT family DNA-binding domain-containing protein n=1 Tax=Mechercharimyces sp. CAU 1602 TaxID=2973933 RepID=UPI002161FEF7|nr:AbrB/MazE/SpoVT family DNA-binding domain-containing protein [Mechercharimyces sp. CAU 1602]MCS1350135.1 AbrB/MazE/SpoVT family DNA-binding domain-containing protein [Mechercharimyces sp. CAU 1602]
MKATGIVRKVDELGRIVLPVELRRTMDIDVRDPIEIYVDGSNIVLKKYSPSCLFCGEVEHVQLYKGKNVCRSCLSDLSSSSSGRSWA